jgi:hypothetical protein
MQSLSPDTLWVVSTFVGAETLSAMTRVSKEWRRVLVEHGRPWVFDRRFPSTGSNVSHTRFMHAMRVLAPTCWVSHTANTEREVLDAVFAQAERVVSAGACNNTRQHDLYLPPRAKIYSVSNGCRCLELALSRLGTSSLAAIRCIRVLYSESARAFRHLKCGATHVMALNVTVRAGEYASAHTLVYNPLGLGHGYFAMHPHLVLILNGRASFDVLVQPGMFGMHRKAVVIISSQCESMFMLLHMVAALDHSRVPVLFVFNINLHPFCERGRFECETLREAAANLGLRLECRNVSSLTQGRDAWWDDADALVAMALEPADRRVRARIGE